MKRILSVLIFSLAALCLIGCAKTEDPIIPGGNVGDDVFYTLTMNDPEWLYEAINDEYAAGETVTVKISFATDLGYIFLLNGEKIENSSDHRMYWEFSFKMPHQNSVIDFKIYDGFLPNANYGVLIESFWLQHPDAEYVSIREYYGEYESGAIVAMIDWCDYTSNVWNETVLDKIFRYIDGNRILVFYEDEFLTLDEAYEKGALTSDDLSDIEDKHSGNQLAVPIRN